ncbi:MAG: hypothetical protein N2745_10965 [Syntrophorhabdaceae bacterium]|nr:hypothetical protein [Syntrophorhabdaceae bacterium]
MLEEDEIRDIKEHAYIPEHIPEYVNAISEAEPFLSEGFIYYRKGGSLIFIGYPLKGDFDEERMRQTLNRIREKNEFEEVFLIAPHLGGEIEDETTGASLDVYYRYDLAQERMPQKVGNMVNRAQRELDVNIHTKMGREHIDLIEEFLDIHSFDDDTRYIFHKIPEYISKSKSALIIEGRDKKGMLYGFDIGEFDSKDYAFYMFNITSKRLYVPGLSDLLLHFLIKIAREKRKRYVNLGLGINSGIRFFKEKWGGTPFLDYRYVRYRHKREGRGILDKLLKGILYRR